MEIASVVTILYALGLDFNYMSWTWIVFTAAKRFCDTQDQEGSISATQLIMIALLLCTRVQDACLLAT